MFKLSSEELSTEFRKYITTKQPSWLAYYGMNSTQIVSFFIADSSGLNAVTNYHNLADIETLLKPILDAELEKLDF